MCDACNMSHICEFVAVVPVLAEILSLMHSQTTWTHPSKCSIVHLPYDSPLRSSTSTPGFTVQ